MSVVTYELHQITSIQDGLLYRVKNEVLVSIGSSPAVFVYKTDGQKFSHYAVVADMEQWPDTYDQAVVAGADFYRAVSVTRDWSTITEMNKDLDVTRARVQALAKELAAVQGSVVIDRTVVISGGA